jgi:glutamate-1-semialdehyde aminotransferase
MTAALDTPGAKELTRRLKKLLPQGMLEEEATAPDPQAMQALQAAEQTILSQQQTIDQLEGVMRQLQSALIDNAKDREVDLLQTMIDSKVKLAIEQMKQEGMNARAAAEIASSTDKEILKAMDKMDVTAPSVVSSQVAPMVVGPQSIDDTEALQTLAAIEAATPSGGSTAQ